MPVLVKTVVPTRPPVELTFVCIRLLPVLEDWEVLKKLVVVCNGAVEGVLLRVIVTMVEVLVPPENVELLELETVDDVDVFKA